MMTRKHKIYLAIGYSFMVYHFKKYQKEMTKAEYKSSKSLCKRLHSVSHMFCTGLEFNEADGLINSLMNSFNPKLTFDIYIMGAYLISEIPKDYPLLTPYISECIDLLEWYAKQDRADYYSNEMMTLELNIGRRINNKNAPILTAKEYSEQRAKLWMKGKKC